MKILMVFMDALRVDYLSTFNGENKDLYLDKYLKNLGGELYTNCFTSGPDTYRSLASLFTGINSDKSDCNSYAKPLHPFGEKYNTIWDEALKNNFSIDIFHIPMEKFIFPEKTQKFISDEINLTNFISNLELGSNHIVWIGLTDFRNYCYYDEYNSNNIYSNFDKLKEPLSILNEKFTNKFNDVLLFSDHGILFDKEFIQIDEKKHQILDERRTQVLFMHKSLTNNIKLTTNDSLCYLSDGYESIRNIMNNNQNKKIENRDFLISEDADFSSMGVSTTPSIFSLITKDYIYIRSFIQQIGMSNSGPNENKAFIVNRKNKTKKLIEADIEKDKLLSTNNNFNQINQIFNFWVKQNIFNKKVKQKLGMPISQRSTLDSMGNIIIYSSNFTLMKFAIFMKDFIPPILVKKIKKWVI